MVSDVEEYLKEDMAPELRERVTELYFQARRFVNTYDLIDDKYLIYTEGTGGDTMIKIFCIDPSGNLDERAEPELYFLFSHPAAGPVL